ncbi:esterase/lipase family protein [Streptomyces sp. NPDC088789]|uniref:esterase/lipase family protein n=1 Tax=Streptomyces sp. NPDC088789 TaxID=3365899 RepID=UPI0037F10DC8
MPTRSRGLMAVALAAGSLATVAAVPPAPGYRSAETGPTAAGPRDIVLVHGINDSSSSWNSMVVKLKSSGYTDAQIHRFDYPSNQNSHVKGTAADLGTFIDKNVKSAKFDIVAHSLGSLISRYWMATASGSYRANDVVNWVSLSGPNHGNQAAGWWGDAAGVYKNFYWDVIPGSDALRTANNGKSYDWKGETGEQSPTQFTTLRSGCDASWFDVPLHVPVQLDKTSLDSTSLGGAINYKVTNTDNTFGGACPSHAGMPGDSAVQQKVVDTLTEEGVGGVYEMSLDKVEMIEADGDDNTHDDLFGYVRVTSSGGANGWNLSNVYWRNDYDDTDSSGNRWLNVPNSSFNRGPWTTCGNGRCGIDAMIVDEDGHTYLDPDDVVVNGSFVWDQRHQGPGSGSAVVQGLAGKARVYYTVRVR